MKNIFIYGSALLFFLGCVEPFDLELDKVKARLVVQGLIENNAGPHYIRLTKSNPGLKVIENNDSGYIDNFFNIIEDAVIVEDATVIITDDFGQTETLELIPKKDELDPYDNTSQEFGGFYKTSNFIGVEGRTYSIKITTIEGEIYTASDHMHPISKIDSIKFQRVMGDIGKDDDYVPMLYFKDPQENEENRYLVQYNKEEDMKIVYGGWDDLWEFAILSDKYFQPGKTGVSIDNGVGPRDWSWYRTWPGDLVYIRMNSLSDQSYNYYKFLLEQFQQDGGAYKPSPASPPTNISNGGLGFFRASAVAEAEAIVGE
jgi:hypothetical protein